MDTAMIALLPTNDEWCEIDLPHLTLVFAGKTEDLNASDFSSLTKDASSLATLGRMIDLSVMGTDVFGPPEDRVYVLELRPSVDLMVMRKFVERWDKSDFPDYKPHCTIGPNPPDPMRIQPSRLMFNRILVAWGDEQVVFWLRP